MNLLFGISKDSSFPSRIKFLRATWLERSLVPFGNACPGRYAAPVSLYWECVVGRTATPITNSDEMHDIHHEERKDVPVLACFAPTVSPTNLCLSPPPKNATSSSIFKPG